MGYINTLGKALKVLIFDKDAMQSLADDNDATKHGFLTLFLVGLIGSLLMLLFQLMIGLVDPSSLGAILISLILNPVFVIILFVIGYSIYQFLAKIFGGKATGVQYFRVMSNVMLVTVPSKIPILGMLINLILAPYLLVLNIFVLKKIHQLSLAKAIIVALIPVVITTIIFLYWFMRIFTAVFSGIPEMPM